MGVRVDNSGNKADMHMLSLQTIEQTSLKPLIGAISLTLTFNWRGKLLMLDYNSLEEVVEAVYTYTFEDFTLSEPP